jgi:hypothetical protein
MAAMMIPQLMNCVFPMKLLLSPRCRTLRRGVKLWCISSVTQEKFVQKLRKPLWFLQGEAMATAIRLAGERPSVLEAILTTPQISHCEPHSRRTSPHILSLSGQRTQVHRWWQLGW